MIQTATFTYLFIYLYSDLLGIYYSVPDIVLSIRIIMENKTIGQAFMKLTHWSEREIPKTHVINAMKS